MNNYDADIIKTQHNEAEAIKALHDSHIFSCSKQKK